MRQEADLALGSDAAADAVRSMRTTGALLASRDLAAAPETTGRISSTGAPLVVAVKANIGVTGLATTSGSPFLLDALPLRDAEIVSRLRRAGADVVGHTTMSELSGWVSFRARRGFSVLAGAPANPYGDRFDTGGSSSGSAVAVAAGCVPAALGTDTGGSVLTPAVNCGIVGLRPSTGALPLDGITPVTSRQDTPGPLTRSVADARQMWGILSGVDPITPDIGDMVLAPVTAGLEAGDADAWASACGRLTRAGLATTAFPSGSFTVGLGDPLVPAHGFRTEIETWLRTTSSAVRSFAQLIDAYRTHRTLYPAGIENLERSARVDPIEDGPRVERTWIHERDDARAILDAARAVGIDILVFPRAAAAYTSSKSGYPALALPAGLRTDGRPFGVTLLSTHPDGEELLLAVGALLEPHGFTHLAPSD